MCNCGYDTSEFDSLHGFLQVAEESIISGDFGSAMISLFQMEAKLNRIKREVLSELIC